MVYNPIFEEECERAEQLKQLRKAIKLRSGKEQFKGLCDKFSSYAQNNPAAVLCAIGTLGLGILCTSDKS